MGAMSDSPRRMITIGQLAAYGGVTIKAVRVYHDRGLLPEPSDAMRCRRSAASGSASSGRLATPTS